MSTWCAGDRGSRLSTGTVARCISSVYHHEVVGRLWRTGRRLLRGYVRVLEVDLKSLDKL